MIKLKLLIILLIITYSPLFSKEGKSLIVSGNSMFPTLKNGDIVYLEEAYYKKNCIKKSELVAIKFSNRKNLMVKRVIATENDKVVINDGRIFINGNDVKKCIPEINKLNILKHQLERYNWRIPNDHVLVFGDNCLKSYDSGEYGFISENQIVGKVYKMK